MFIHSVTALSPFYIVHVRISYCLSSYISVKHTFTCVLGFFFYNNCFVRKRFVDFSLQLSPGAAILSDCLYIWLSVCLHICMSDCRSDCISVCLYVCLSNCLYICLSICLSDCL